MKKQKKIVLAVIAAICLFNTNIVKSQNVEDLTGYQCSQMWLHYASGIDVKKDLNKAQYYAKAATQKGYKLQYKGEANNLDEILSSADLSDAVSFEKTVQPLLNAKCYAIHHCVNCVNSVGQMNHKNCSFTQPLGFDVIKENDGTLSAARCTCCLKKVIRIILNELKKEHQKQERSRQEEQNLLKKVKKQ